MSFRVGIVGPGGMGRSHVAAVLDHPEAELVAACDVNADVLKEVTDKAAGCRPYTDYRAMLGDDGPEMDVVCVILPHHLYPDCVCRALARGCHVIKEKPLARNLADALTMARKARETGRRLLVGSQQKFTSPARRTHELVASGRLGEVYLADATIRYRWGHAWNGGWRWRGKRAQSGGVAIVDSGWHILDTLAWCIGTPSRVYASTGSARPIPGDDYDVDLLGAMVLDYADGAVAHVLATYTCLPGEFRLCLHGARADLEFGDKTIRIWTDGVLDEVTQLDPGGTEQPISRQFYHCVACLKDGTPGVNDITTALDVQRTIEAAYRSAETGQPVDMTDMETL